MQSRLPEIKASPRNIFGKKARFLRRAGSVPANLFGRGMQSLSIQINHREIEHVLAHVPRASLLTLTVESGPSETVLIRGVARKPTTDELYHVDFYRVSMTERLRTSVPLAFLGESAAARAHGATVVHSLDALEVECLPADLPTRIEVDLEALREIDDAIYVRDLALPKDVTILSSHDLLVAKALAPTVAEVPEEVIEAAEPAPVTAAEPQGQQAKQE